MSKVADWHVPLLTLFILLFCLGVNVLFLFSPTRLLVNQLFSPCENGFSYDTQQNQCNCIDPFYGDYCELSKCEHGSVAVKQQFGWSCECRDLWFGSYCQFCGTHDATNDTCYGDAPYPQGSLCRSEPSSFGELEFLGTRCDLVCVKQMNSRVLSGDALEVYEIMKEGAPLSVLACPDALCYACDSGSREALCVDGALKSEASRECDTVCDPCTEQSCRPCSRRGACNLRGDYAVCACNPLSRGLVCESLCPGVTEIFNGPSAVLVGPECYGNGICNNEAVCECLQDINGVSMFVPEATCEKACPLNVAGVVCSGHGTCTNGVEATCACDPGWYGPLCSCNDGSTAAKTCVHGDCQVDGSCLCHDDDVLGHWDGPFCSICAANYFTEATFCTQYCNPATTCHDHALSCVMDPVQFDEAGLAIPCREENGALLGTCARCLCNPNFDASVVLEPAFPEYADAKSLGYQCGTCKSDYYPQVATKAFDADDVCNVFCDLSTCNNRGVCLKASGNCVCYGSCPVDQTSYVGTCLQREGIDVIQPHYEELSSCASCDPYWGPLLPDWQLSCTTYCDAAGTELSTFPSECYDGDGFIRSECVFCSGRAENCTSLGMQPVCNCNDGYTGTYCQSTCGSATSNACNNGVCEEDRLANYFDFATPEYKKRSEDSWKCRCDPQDDVTEEERSLYEDSFYTITSFNLDSVEIENLGLPAKPEFFGSNCASECKRSLSGDICSGNGNCKTVYLNVACSSDSECNNIDGSRENKELFCYKEQRPKFFQLLRQLSSTNLPACRASEVSFMHDLLFPSFCMYRVCFSV